MESLKLFVLNPTRSEVKVRLELLKDINHLITSKSELPDAVLRASVLALSKTLGIYKDTKSRRECETLVQTLLLKHRSVCEPSILQYLTDVSKFQLANHSASRSESARALCALSWSCIIAESLFTSDVDTGSWDKLLNIQSALYYGTQASKHRSVCSSANRKMISLWKKFPGTFQQYSKTLLTGEASISKCCLLALLTSHFGNDSSSIKDEVVSAFVKAVLMSKTAPSDAALSCCIPLIRLFDHKDFADILIPAFQKALLRNPDSALPTIQHLVQSLPIDLSRHSLSLSKILVSQLVSKHDANREISLQTFVAMATQCSDVDVVSDLMKYLFGVLKGSEGKLTLVGQKQSVLEAIRGFAASGIGSGESPALLAASVTAMFLPFLQQELHEGTLVVGVRALAAWCAKLRKQVPPPLMEWFLKATTLKSSTPTVRTEYVECMSQAFRSDMLPMVEPLIPYLLQTMEKAVKQSSQIGLVTEALYAACLLVKLENVEFKKSYKMTDFWSSLLDAKKSLFTSDKFLHNVQEEALLKVNSLVACLLLEHPQKVSADMAQQFHKSLVHNILHKSWPVRSTSIKTVKHLLSNVPGTAFCTAMLDQYFNTLRPSCVVDFSSMDDVTEAKKSYISPKRFVNALQCLINVPTLLSDAAAAEEVAIFIMVDVHHPCIVDMNDHIWTDFLYKCGFDAHKFVTDKIDAIAAKLIKCSQHTQSSLTALSSVTRIAPDVVCPYVINESLDVLRMNELRHVTKNEVQIMKTPSGSLWNLKIIDRAPKIVENKNVKRENKLYSFKEQQAGMELKREQEQKQKGVGTGGGLGQGEPGAPPIPKNLTKKQKELVESELEKEGNIRNKLLKVDLSFHSTYQVLKTTLTTCQSITATSSHLICIINPLLNLLSSPLVSCRVQDIYVDLSQAMMADNKDLGLQVAYVTLRLSDPCDDVEPAWCIEARSAAVLRILSRICSTGRDPLPAAAFAYIFPFLRLILKAGGKVVNSDTKVICDALRFIQTNAQVRDTSKMGIFTPKLLPRVDMLESMSQLVGTSLVHVQQAASVVLQEVCQAASGGDGCAYASVAEINTLLQNLLSPTATLRGVTLKGLLHLGDVLCDNEDEKTEKNIIRRAWVAMHDVDEENQKLAVELWERLEFDLTTSVFDDLLDDVQYHEPIIQQFAASALHEALAKHPQSVTPILQKLFHIYNLKLERAPPVLDQLGRIIAESPPDQYQPRIGVALAVKAISPLLQKSDVHPLFSFFVPDAVGDRHPEVRRTMLEAALQAVNDHGKETTSDLLQIFEVFLEEAPTSESYDSIRQSIVILLGTLARHLDKTDPKVKPIVKKLTGALSTPSQAVQESVANCLPPLIPSIKDDAPDIVQKLLHILLESENYGERKGAAYGLAGMVKGLGIISFKQHDIINKLTEAIQDKKNYRHREGSLLAFEMFCGMLGRLFEPYIVHLLPHLLLCFGDGNQYVREAADNTARAVMRNLSAHGVRLVLPSLLNALNEDLWRTKTGSAELLGAMAHCAPKQLSSCLPNIVPKLCEVLTDSHPKVQKAGQQALKQIGSVIRNPEIQAISNILLAALSDPSHKTTICLETLLNTKFVHFIDAPSLALILPVVERAFQDRSIDTRKMAAQIIGNMYSLTDQKDLNPYLPAVIPGLKNTLLDPVPEVRAIAAKALGAMVKETGESQFRELLPWMMEKLTSEQSSVDRSGAAQGLSEILAALGPDQLAKLMPEVVRTADSDTIPPHVREGYIMLFVYLPCTFNDDFIPYIGDVIPPILKALADENEFVRTTALGAGQRIISMFADTAISVLLPQLERGLFDDNWRIRLSSIQLLGDLLYQISGVTGKMSATGDEDDNFGTAEGFKTLVERLGRERRDLVLSGLYMGRSDVAVRVRQSSLHVWKIIVPNTPRTLREILPTLFKLLLGCLASPSYDKRQVAAKTLGDIVRKLGERMLPELIPILEKGLDSEEAAQREGVCIGLTEIIKSCSKDAIIVFSDNLVPTVRKALCDPLDGVRQAAASTFEHLHNTIGVQALDEIIPSLLANLKDDVTSTYAVDGLRHIISVKGRVVLPFIVPKLIEPPINTEILAFLSSVAGEALTKHLPIILKALLSALVDASDVVTTFDSVLGDCKVVINSIEGEHGMRIIVDDLLAGLKLSDANNRHASVVLLCAFCKNKDADYADYVPVFLQSFIKLLADPEERIQLVAWDALSAVTATLDPADMQRHVSSVRHALRFIKNDEIVQRSGTLPGFCLPKKGMTPLLAIFREGILNGSPDLKEQSSRGLAECIQLLTPAALKPSVVQITGPLIRILGDRFNSNVRIAFLETLSLLLSKVGAFLKPFLPQLQTTFSKALQDPNRAVRLQAGKALALLCFIHTRIDPLFTDLNNNINNLDDNSVRETLLQALRGCVSNGGKKMSSKVKSELISTLSSQLSSDDDTISKCAAGCLGNLCKFMDDAEISQIMTQQILVKDPSASWSLRQSRSALLAVALKEACSEVLNDQWESKILDQVLSYCGLDRVQIVTHGIHCAAYILLHYSRSGDVAPGHVLTSFKHGVENASNDVKMEACKSLVWVEQHLNEPHGVQGNNGVAEINLPEKSLLFFVSLLLPLAREKNTGVKSAAEFSLVSLLKLRHSEDFMQTFSSNLPSRDSTSLFELHKQRLKKVATTPEVFEDIDSTILRS